MHTTLVQLKTELEGLAQQIRSMAEVRATSTATGQFNAVGINREELADRAQMVADRIANEGPDVLSEASQQLLGDYVARLQLVKTNTTPQFWNGGNAGASVVAYLATLDALERALRPVLSLREAELIEAQKKVRQLQSSLRSLQSRYDSLKPKVENLDAAVQEILDAHSAAERLPTDLQTLREVQQELNDLRSTAKEKSESISQIEGSSQRISEELQRSADSAKQVVEWSEKAMRTSTAVGLAGAFHDRAEKLNISIYIWVAGLVVALVGGAWLGGSQLHQLADAIQGSTSPSIVWTRLSISLLSVGGPIWFAWLATKQIGQRFKLAEDYAYKASVSKAYEGYRREALHLDEEFQKRLFSTALTRLDEQPLRFVETETHGSPWHELLSSDIVKEALRIAPELAGQFTQQARDKVKAAKEKGKAEKKGESVAAEAD